MHVLVINAIPETDKDYHFPDRVGQKRLNVTFVRDLVVAQHMLSQTPDIGYVVTHDAERRTSSAVSEGEVEWFINSLRLDYGGEKHIIVLSYAPASKLFKEKRCLVVTPNDFKEDPIRHLMRVGS